MTQKAPIQPVKPMSRQDFRRVLEESREDIARLMAAKTNDLNVLYGLLNTNTTLWLATQPDEAPEYETEVRVVRSA